MCLLDVPVHVYKYAFTHAYIIANIQLYTCREGSNSFCVFSHYVQSTPCEEIITAKNKYIQQENKPYISKRFLYMSNFKKNKKFFNKIAFNIEESHDALSGEIESLDGCLYSLRPRRWLSTCPLHCRTVGCSPSRRRARCNKVKDSNYN